MNNNRYILSIILNVTLAALLFVVTIMYAIRTHPIIKILALFLNILAIYNTYKTIINKPKANQQDHLMDSIRYAVYSRWKNRNDFFVV